MTASGGFTFTATAGSTAASQTVATFIDTGGAEALADYTAAIDWGDGTSATAATLSVDPNTDIFTVSGAHGYAQDGTFNVTVALAHEAAPTVTATSTASITAAPPPLLLSLVDDTPATATEGSSVTLTNTSLQTTDSDTSVPPSTILYTITAAPTLGTLADDGNPLAAGDEFSQQDINDGIVTYQSDGRRRRFVRLQRRGRRGFADQRHVFHFVVRRAVDGRAAQVRCAGPLR